MCVQIHIDKCIQTECQFKFKVLGMNCEEGPILFLWSKKSARSFVSRCVCVMPHLSFTQGQRVIASPATANATTCQPLRRYGNAITFLYAHVSL